METFIATHISPITTVTVEADTTDGETFEEVCLMVPVTGVKADAPKERVDFDLVLTLEAASGLLLSLLTTDQRNLLGV